MRYKALFLMVMLLPVTWAMGQKQKTVEFTAANLPTELLEYLNKATSDSDKQKANTKVVASFRSAYDMMTPAMQQRVADIYTYAVKAHLKGNPDIANLATTMTAYSGNPNFGDWVSALEQMRKRAAKAKPVNDFVDFSSLLLSERVLYRSSSCEWRFDTKTPFRIVVNDGAVTVHFDSPADLHYASAKDASVIHGTTGVYYYKDNRWVGNGGRIDWSRTGLGAEACYAELSHYQAETKFPKFTADSVQFVNTHYFSHPIPGRIEEVLSSAMEPEKYGYPRFRSYQRDFVIKDILPDIDYSGSFMMNGSKFITASSKHPASLIFKRAGKAQLAVTSLKFTITPDRLMAENAMVAFYLGEDDSISNTGITVRYLPADKKVTLINDAKRNFYSPYIDTYHQLDIYSEALTWNINTDEVEFSGLGSSGTVSTASFESSSYYTYKKYREIQGIDDVSPVKRVYDYAEANTYYFSVSKFADYIGLDMSQALLMIHTLAHHGLVSYNEITGYVLVKDKLEDYVKAFSHAKGFDYDALTLESSTRGINARLTLADNVLDMRGVEKFVVSDSLRVMVYPRSGKLSVGKNRSIHFNGRVDAGKFILFVSDCDYSYEQFNFDMPHVDSVFFYVPEFDNPDTDHIVYTPLYNLVGTLHVDKPDNHCGLTKNKEYPMFDSRENSFVYFDKSIIQGGQYTKDRFYYTLHPFTIRSMGDFVTDSVKFNGVLTSANIFPDITYPLSVQRDYYLGFQVETPDGGYPTYGGKGTYRHHISLDHNGLRGNGNLQYLASNSRSKDFLFLPDSMLAITDTFYVREEQGFPDIRNGRTSQHWLPYLDSMAVASIKQGNAFQMYHNDAILRGHVAVQPSGASAAGVATMNEATLSSPYFKLQTMEMDARVSDFTLRSNTFNAIAFTAKGVISHVDYKKRRADLQSPAGMTRTELQLVQYEAYADKFSWEMDKKELDLLNSTRESSEGLDAMDVRMRLGKLHDMPGVRFVSTDAAKKQLTYNSLRSVYHYEKGDLSSKGVYLIQVADAAIAPNADTVHIAKGGTMRVLNNANLVCNRDSAFHLIYNADLLVEASDNYSGKGYIDYVDDVDKVQRLFLSNISVSPQGITMAQGNISAESDFTLSSAFGFAGKVRAEGNRRELFFDGGVRLLQNCIANDKLGLLAYADYTDPAHVHINVPKLPTDWKGHRITASILMEPSILQPQTAFLTNDRAADNELLSASGVLTYLGDRGQYMIGSEEKVSDPDAVVEPYLALNTSDCTVEGEGPVDFTMKRTQANLYTYGLGSFGVRRYDDDYLSTVFGITFPISQELVTSLAANIKDDLRLAPVSPKTNPALMHALMYHLGADEGAAVYADYSENGKFEELPQAMRSMLLFDNVRWLYAPSMGYFYDGKVGLIAVDGEQLNLEMKLKAQITMRSGSQQIILYLQAANDHWYYFKFDSNSQELIVYSSNGLWLDKIKALSPDQRRVSKDGLGTFRYYVGNNTSEVSTYLRWFAETAYSRP